MNMSYTSKALENQSLPKRLNSNLRYSVLKRFPVSGLLVSKLINTVKSPLMEEWMMALMMTP